MENSKGFDEGMRNNVNSEVKNFLIKTKNEMDDYIEVCAEKYVSQELGIEDGESKERMKLSYKEMMEEKIKTTI